MEPEREPERELVQVLRTIVERELAADGLQVSWAMESEKLWRATRVEVQVLGNGAILNTYLRPAHGAQTLLLGDVGLGVAGVAVRLRVYAGEWGPWSALAQVDL